MRTYNMTMPELTLPNIKSLLYPLSASQDLNGYSKPWAGGLGKNLLPALTYESSATIIYIGAESNGYTIHLGAGTYTLTTNASIVRSAYYREENDSANTAIATNISAGSVSHTFTVAGGTYRFWLYARDGITASDIVNFQLEAGQQATSYEPYSNICPISGTTEVKVTRTGKNLFSGDTVSLAKPSTRTKAFNIARIPAGTYEISWEYSGTSTNTRVVFRKAGGVTEDQLEVVLTQSSPKTVTFTVDMSACYCFIATSQADGVTAEISKMMIRKVGTSDSYEPYQGNTYTTDLGQTVYGGTLDVTSGLLTVTHKIITPNGTGSYASLNQVRKSGVATVNSYYFSPDAESTSQAVGEKLCNMFEWSDNADVASSASGTFYMATGQYRFTLPMDDTKNTAELVNAWIAQLYTNGTPLQLCVPLNTPTTVQLTPTQVETLAGSNTVMSDKTITLTFNGQTLTGQAVTFDAEGRRVVCMFMPTT